MSIIYEPHDCVPARSDAMSGHAYKSGLLWQCDTCARVYRFDAGDWELVADPWSDYALSEARARAARGIDREARHDARKAAPGSSPVATAAREAMARKWQGEAFTRANARPGVQAPAPAPTAAPTAPRLEYYPGLAEWLEETMMPNRTAAPAPAEATATGQDRPEDPAPGHLPLESFSLIVRDAARAALPRIPREQGTGLTIDALDAAVRAVDYMAKRWKHQRSPDDASAHRAAMASAAVVAVALFQQLEREEQAK